MPVSFFNNEGEDRSVIEQMLADSAARSGVAATDKSGYTILRPEHTYRLLDLPSGTILRLASMLGMKDVKDLMDRLWQADNEDDLGTLGRGINFLNSRVIVAVHGSATPDFMDSLSLSMSNFIILWQALYNFLKEGNREVLIEWTDTVGLDSLPKGHRIPFLLAYDWLSLTLMSVNVYMERNLKERAPVSADLPLPIVPIQPEGESDLEGELLGYGVGIHKPGQDDYELWLRLFFDGQVDFSFVPLWEEPAHLQKLIENLAQLEAESRSTLVDISSAWKTLPRAGGNGLEADISSLFGPEQGGPDSDLMVRFRFGLPEGFKY